MLTAGPLLVMVSTNMEAPPSQPSSGEPGRSAVSPGPGDVPWLLQVVLIAIGVRLLWVLYVNVDPNDGRFDDSVFYHNAAHLLAQGRGYINPFNGDPTAHWPPGYPAVLAILYKLFGWHLMLARALNIGFAAVTVALAYVVGRRVFDRRAAYLGALILVLFPGQVYFSALVLTETMFAMLFMLALLLALVWTVEREKARWWQVLLIGILVGAAGLVRSEGVFLVVVLAGLWALTVRPWRRLAGYVGLLALGTALALAPWTIRNAIQLDQLIPLRANASVSLARALDPEEERPAITLEEVTTSAGEGFRHQIRHPWEILPLAGRKIGNFYENDAEGIDWIQHPPRETDQGVEPKPPLTEEEAARWRGLADRYFFAAGSAALVAAVLALAWRNRPALVLIAAGLGWTLLFGFINPVSRFHFALGPVIAIFAGAFLVFLWDGAGAVKGRVRVRLRRFRPAGADS
jgi:hypothetical protein